MTKLEPCLQVNSLVAEATPYSSVVGGSVSFVSPDGPVVAIAAIMIPNPQFDYKAYAVPLANEIVKRWNNRTTAPLAAELVEALVKCMDALKTIHEFPITHLIENQDATNMALIAGEALAQAKQALGEGETKFDDPQFATSLEELEELIWSRAEILRLNVSLNRLRDQIADPETVTITRNRYEQYQRAEAELTLERKKLEDLLKGENK